MSKIIPIERVEQRIYLIRGQKVMLDSDLAVLYQVSTKRLNEQVNRNRTRFPEDFMFQLTKDEFDSLQETLLRSHFATSKRGGRRYLPNVFTEQGVAMLSSVLSSERAAQVNIAIMRAFVKLRQVLATHKDLAEKIEKIEAKSDAKFDRHDKEIQIIFETIKRMLEAPPAPKKGKIGLHRDG